MFRCMARGVNAFRRLPRAVNRRARALIRALRSPRADNGNEVPVAETEMNGSGRRGDAVERDATSVTSGSSCATIPSRRYSYRNHWYPTESETPSERDEDDGDDSEGSSVGRGPVENARDVRPESEEGADETDGSDSDSDRGSVRSWRSESSGVTIPLRRTRMFDPSNRWFDPAYSGRDYLTRGGHETVARAEYSYAHRYYRTFSETSLED